MGIVHVLTGPDHLSALATLSSNTGNFKAFWYGVRWGIGHSIGLISVGSIMITVSFHNHKTEDESEGIGMPEKLESALESVVGFFMLLLGIYGLLSAYRKKSKKELEYELTKLESDTDNEMSIGIDTGSDFTICDEMEENNNGSNWHEDGTYENPSSSATLNNLEDNMLSQSDTTPTITLPNHDDDNNNNSLHDCGGEHHHHHGGWCLRILLYIPLPNCCREAFRKSMENAYSKQILSLCIGIVHGVAGPGGVLGIIPAVQLHDWKLAILYLGTFCVTSTLVMGSFAALYGYISAYIIEKSDRGQGIDLEFWVAVFSSSLSIFVGLLWLILISLGKLHDFFP